MWRVYGVRPRVSSGTKNAEKKSNETIDVELHTRFRLWNTLCTISEIWRVNPTVFMTYPDFI